MDRKFSDRGKALNECNTEKPVLSYILSSYYSLRKCHHYYHHHHYRYYHHRYHYHYHCCYINPPHPSNPSSHPFILSIILCRAFLTINFSNSLAVLEEATTPVNEIANYFVKCKPMYLNV